jgi:hypothetical protein
MTTSNSISVKASRAESRPCNSFFNAGIKRQIL